MKIAPFRDHDANVFDTDPANGVTGRVVIGKSDGATNFCMRTFEIKPGGHTPRHSHDWEHEIFFHQGEGEVFEDGVYVPVKHGDIAFIPGGEEHQIRNTGQSDLIFVCVIPSGYPEL